MSQLFSQIASYSAPDKVTGMASIGERLRVAMRDRGVDQAELARRVGVAQGTISLIILNKTRQSKHLPRIARELDLSLDWLLGQSDEMTSSERSELSKDEEDLISCFNSLDEEEQAALLKIARSMAGRVSPSRRIHEGPLEYRAPEKDAH